MQLGLRAVLGAHHAEHSAEGTHEDVLHPGRRGVDQQQGADRRVNQDGYDWERPAPDEPWANLGYWGDHQLIYLLQFLDPRTVTENTMRRGFVPEPEAE